NLQVGDFFTVTGSSGTGYNVEHAVNTILNNSTVVTDQPYSVNATGGTAYNCELPHFTATFYNPPPTITKPTIPTSPRSATLQVPLSAVVDSAFTSTTTVDLYIDTDASGYNGKLIAHSIPYTADPAGKITAQAVANIPNLLPRNYYLYAVIN